MAGTTTSASPVDLRQGEALVRMYRQGLGDCFLVQLPRDDGSVFKIMIDCGVILGTQDATAKMEKVVDDIIATTDGSVDLLVVTHEHWDHVSGFVQAESRFAKADEDKSKGKLKVGEVWFAWTENKADPMARRLEHGLGALLKEIRQKAQGFKLRASNGGKADRTASVFADELEGILAFHGETLDDAAFGAAGASKTRQAMTIAAAIAPIRYREPGEAPIVLPGCKDVRVYVLGPPRDPELLNKTEPRAEGYHFARQLFAAAEDTGEPDRYEAPFDAGIAIPLDDDTGAELIAKTQQTPIERFFVQHYFQDKVPETYQTRDSEPTRAGDDAAAKPATAGRTVMKPRDVLVDQSWRRIDRNEMAEATELALQLDGATNNTSMVLALELGAGGPVLMFVGDAQAGNWLSWDDLPPWRVGRRQVTAADLLARTVFYKVGHHGSHNATFKRRGIERMTHRDLVAFVPVDRPMARKKRWMRMPLPSLIEALRLKTGDRVVLSETAPPESEPVVELRKDWADLRTEKLYFEVRVPSRTS
ncbi:MBL fold metallo-hydrolase [Boseaceae bacterium BT-24-1]|nr:MBL fold metallo-hydrolase [Boseaceae bacterium BT-24-1]